MNLKAGENQPIAGKSFSVHLGPLLMVEVVVEPEGVRLELREFIDEAAPG